MIRSDNDLFCDLGKLMTIDLSDIQCDVDITPIIEDSFLKTRRVISIVDNIVHISASSILSC